MRIYQLLFEAEKGEIPEKMDDDVRVGKKTKLARDSVDDQIDSLLVKYESESLREEDEEVSLEESFFKKNLKTLLFEQEEALDPAADEETIPLNHELECVHPLQHPSSQRGIAVTPLIGR